MASKPAFKALRAAEKGKEIFFYHEQRTSQVVYSFTRALKVRPHYHLPALS